MTLLSGTLGRQSYLEWQEVEQWLLKTVLGGWVLRRIKRQIWGDENALMTVVVITRVYSLLKPY